MASTGIYWFSGTGNTLHAAREIQKGLSDAEMVPVCAYLQQETIEIPYETVILVYPTHLMTVPYPVRQFLLKADFTKVRIIYAVTTCLGIKNISDAAINRILSCQGKRVDAIFIIVMTSNSPTGVRPGRGDTKWKYHITDENIQKREENVVQTVPRIVLSVQNGKAHPRKIGLLEIMLERLMTRLTRNASVTLRYYADATCTSCGVCERICPSGRITMEDGRPAWNAAIKCYYCYACFNYCPHQSILLPNYTEKNGRYHHPAVSAADIASQKDMPC